MSYEYATTPTVWAPAPRRKPKGAEALTGLRHNVLAASRWRGSWEAGCQQLTAEMGVNDQIMHMRKTATLSLHTHRMLISAHALFLAFSTFFQVPMSAL